MHSSPHRTLLRPSTRRRSTPTPLPGSRIGCSVTLRSPSSFPEPCRVLIAAPVPMPRPCRLPLVPSPVNMRQRFADMSTHQLVLPSPMTLPHPPHRPLRLIPALRHVYRAPRRPWFTPRLFRMKPQIPVQAASTPMPTSPTHLALSLVARRWSCGALRLLIARSRCPVVRPLRTCCP